MKIILVAVTFGLIALTINLMGYPQETIRVVYFIGLYVVLAAFNQMFYAIFQALERMEFQAIGQTLNAVLILGGVIFAIKHGFGVVGFASLYVIASAIALSYSFAVMKLKFSNPTSASANKALEFDWSFWKPTIKQALPFGLTSIFITIFYYIDSVMLSTMKGNEAVGWYNAAYRLVFIPSFIPIVFNSAIFPVMARFSITSKASLEFIYQRYFKYMVLLSIPIAVGTTLLSDRFILLVFGQEYAPAVIALQILIWTIIAVFVSGVFGRLVESLNKQILGTKVSGIAAALSVVLNLILIPKYGYVGASASAVVTYFTVLILMGVVSFRLGYSIPRGEIVKNVGKVIAASAAMGLFIWYCSNLNLIALIALSILIYSIFIGILKFFDKEDINLAKQLLRSRE
jgi:O-antigen/teichoic acid export membrane protein